jgi:hypothetical protein
VWNMSFGIGDTNTAATSLCQMFCGLTISTVAPAFAAALGPNTSTVQSILGVGCDVGDSVFSFYNKGVTTTNPKIPTSFSCATPCALWFNLTIVDQSNSNVVAVTLSEQTTGVSVTQVFTMNLATTILNTSLLYPIYIRSMGSPSITNSAQTLLRKFQLFLK